jgi:RNAse (barnase) inhibitor barstar
MSLFKYNESELTLDSKSLICTLFSEGIRNGNDLHNTIYYVLNFPNYYGFNWDALNDCLSDFHWLNHEKITLVHENLPLLSDHELKIYLEILRDAVLIHKKDVSHITKKIIFEVAFRGDNVKEKITALLGDC